MIDAGLCVRCVDGRRLISGRGSVFWRCAVHDRDPRVAKYPRLPVRGCPYFRERGPEDGVEDGVEDGGGGDVG